MGIELLASPSTGVACRGHALICAPCAVEDELCMRLDLRREEIRQHSCRCSYCCSGVGNVVVTDRGQIIPWLLRLHTLCMVLFSLSLGVGVVVNSGLGSTVIASSVAVETWPRSCRMTGVVSAHILTPRPCRPRLNARILSWEVDVAVENRTAPGLA
jgi:hypothetical protein